jgi:hypothetical protein
LQKSEPGIAAGLPIFATNAARSGVLRQALVMLLAASLPRSVTTS